MRWLPNIITCSSISYYTQYIDFNKITELVSFTAEFQGIGGLGNYNKAEDYFWTTLLCNRVILQSCVISKYFPSDNLSKVFGEQFFEISIAQPDTYLIEYYKYKYSQVSSLDHQELFAQ